MSEISFEQFERKIGVATFAARDLVEYTKRRLVRDHMFFGSKGRDLPEVVQQILNSGLFPVVDKKLRLVIGVPFGEHAVLLGRLQDYHVEEEKIALTEDELRHNADTYIKSGRGYYISGAEQDRGRRTKITMSANYKPDQYDKDLFMLYDKDIL